MKGLCTECRWFLAQDLSELPEFHNKVPFTCLAFFPNPIPEAIFTGEQSHKEPLPEQENDRVFTPLMVYL